MGLWAQLQVGIKRTMDKRRFELITFAAAHTMRSTLCSLAHGRALTQFFPPEDVQLMARGASPASLTAAVTAYAPRATLRAKAIIAASAAVAARAFFSSLC